jgi:membrane protein implicated in regulation of membrane protease activity
MSLFKEANFNPFFIKTGGILSTLFSPSYPQQLPQLAQGTVDRLIAYGQTGRVKYRGTYWSAQLYRPERGICILVGEPVEIMAIRGITLLVTPVS